MAGKNTAVIGIYKGSAFGAHQKWVLPQFPCNSGDNRAGVAPITAFESVLAPQAALAWVIVLAHSGDLACKCSEHSHLCASVRQYLHGNCGRAHFSRVPKLHAGICPDSVVGDYSDVRVSSPYGDIPWPKVSRLNDDEMKGLMIDVVNRTYRFIHKLFDENTDGELLLRLAERDPLPRWNEPTLLDEVSTRRFPD